VVLSALLLCPSLPAEPDLGSICVAPVPANPSPTMAPGVGVFCPSAKLSLKIDSGAAIAWPIWKINKSVRVEGLDTTSSHVIVILCGGQREQSFRFRFSEFQSHQLCLFFNDLYKTAQLWEAGRGTPWCKCARATSACRVGETLRRSTGS
jgi:hypothetical protein